MIEKSTKNISSVQRKSTEWYILQFLCSNFYYFQKQKLFHILKPAIFSEFALDICIIYFVSYVLGLNCEHQFCVFKNVPAAMLKIVRC